MKRDVGLDSMYGVRFLLPYLKDHSRGAIVIAISMILVAVTSALSAYMFKYILNDIFIAKDEWMLIVLPIVVILLFLTRGVSRFTSSYMTAKVGVSVANRLRSDMFGRLIDAHYRYRGSLTTGDTNSIVIQTALNIQNIISKSIPQLIISLLTVVSLIILILYTDVRLALYAVSIGILMILPVKLLSKGVKRHASHSEDTISKLSNSLNEALTNLELIKVYSREGEMKSLFDFSLDNYREHQLKLAKYQLLSSPFMEFFVASAISVVVYVGGGFVIDGSMSAGDFFAFMVALMMLYAPIKNLTQNYSTLFALNSYIQRVEQILDIPLESADGGDSIVEIESIRFDRVSYRIGDTDILQDITIDIKKGDRVAIVGRSGAGKSSLISLLCGLADPTGGEIVINSKPMEQISIDSIRQSISYVNQSAGVFNSSIKENIIYGREMDEVRYSRVIVDARCDFIDLLDGGDSYIVGEGGSRLSGGQRQRVAMARAMYRDGSLFILDEATSGLDTNTEVKIQQALERILSEHTSIIIAHRLSTIQQCNRVVVLESGRIVAYGSYDEVSSTDEFRINFGMKSDI